MQTEGLNFQGDFQVLFFVEWSPFLFCSPYLISLEDPKMRVISNLKECVFCAHKRNTKCAQFPTHFVRIFTAYCVSKTGQNDEKSQFLS